MNRALPTALALAGLVLCQGIVRPEALAERDTWPTLESHKSIIIKHAHPVLGREMTADILWAQTIVHYGSSMVDGTEFRYLVPYLDAIIELDPRFKPVYRFAAYAVDTFQQGAAREQELLTSLEYLYKAMEEYPDDHEYPWIAGSRYFRDLRPEDPERAAMYKERGAALIEEAMRKPDAPASYAELASAFRSKLGQHEQAIANLKEKLLTAPDDESRAALLDRLRDTYDVPDLAEELEAATRELQEAWQANLPYGSPSLFVILGERPDPVIEFDRLANERDLFGADLE